MIEIMCADAIIVFAERQQNAPFQILRIVNTFPMFRIIQLELIQKPFRMPVKWVAIVQKSNLLGIRAYVKTFRRNSFGH